MERENNPARIARGPGPAALGPMPLPLLAAILLILSLWARGDRILEQYTVQLPSHARATLYWGCGHIGLGRQPSAAPPLGYGSHLLIGPFHKELSSDLGMRDLLNLPLIPGAKSVDWTWTIDVRISWLVGVILGLDALRRLLRYAVARRRLRRGRCPQCRYNIRFGPSGCPECGWGREPAAQRRPWRWKKLAGAAAALLVILALSRTLAVPSPPAHPMTASARQPGFGYIEQIPNGSGWRKWPPVDLHMVYIPPGRFQRCWRTAQGEIRSKGDVHLNGFWISRCEITWELIDAWQRASPDQLEALIPGGNLFSKRLPRPVDMQATADRSSPVVGLTPYAAQMLCLWLTRSTGRLYRLPTEAEWEYVALAGSDAPDQTPADLHATAWFGEAANAGPHRVGLKQPNRWGVYDLYGNVAEWVGDGWTPTPQVSETGPLVNPFVPPKPGVAWSDDTFGVVKGGDWTRSAQTLHPAWRQQRLLGDVRNVGLSNWVDTTEAGKRTGFRIVSQEDSRPDARSTPVMSDPTDS